MLTSRLALHAALHLRVLDGDEAAREEIACLLVRLVGERIRRFAPRADPALTSESVHDAILDYLTAPRSFDSSKSRLDTFIGLAARRNLIDRVRRLRRVAATEVTLGHPLNEHFAQTLPALEEGRSIASIVPILAVVARSAAERAFLKARIQGERRTEVLARILGMAGSPIYEQRRAVKRMADRLRFRLRQLGDKTV